jgi:hypothetical protein
LFVLLRTETICSVLVSVVSRTAHGLVGQPAPGRPATDRLLDQERSVGRGAGGVLLRGFEPLGGPSGPMARGDAQR